jgi:hypothetical protein
VLAGAAGVGKTRLAREALAAAEQRGALTRWAVATASARALPLGAFAATLGVVGPDPARLVGQASAALLAGAGRSGVVIGVDDAHLLDEFSAVVVHQRKLIDELSPRWRTLIQILLTDDPFSYNKLSRSTGIPLGGSGELPTGCNRQPSTGQGRRHECNHLWSSPTGSARIPPPRVEQRAWVCVVNPTGYSCARDAATQDR